MPNEMGDWEDKMREFAEADRADPPEPGGVVFTGSSSIVFWETLEEDFPGLNVLNRGFGGSTLADVLHYADRVITPYEPRAVVLYAGAHDIRRGASPQRVRELFRDLCAFVHEPSPETDVLYLAMKPSIKSWDRIDDFRAGNRAIREFAETADRVEFVDVHTPMFDGGERPAERYFAEDLNHLSREGYRLWADILGPHITP